ncbi:MAG TPA: hypothetical protein DEP05_10075 [Betaproteobacteria bacterium]|nr:hypothetical protein [Betaproteobacteria bacterium]
MPDFVVFKHPDDNLQVVKDGFSWVGLVFGQFWLLYHRIYLIGSILFIIGIVFYFLFPSPDGYILGIPYGHRFGVADILNIAIAIGIGVAGNFLRVDSLRKRGYVQVFDITAPTADAARARYLLSRDRDADNRDFIDKSVDL